MVEYKKCPRCGGNKIEIRKELENFIGGKSITPYSYCDEPGCDWDQSEGKN